MRAGWDDRQPAYGCFGTSTLADIAGLRPRAVDSISIQLAKPASRDANSFGKPKVADTLWNHIPSARGGVENGMETMKVHVLERALTAACVVAAIAVVWWGVKILAA